MNRYTAQRRSPLLCAVFVFGACTAPSGEDSAAAPTDAAPKITAAAAQCDPTRAEWTFSATTDAWTGNGQVLLTTDGAYLERHTLFSTSAAPDGTADTLELSLDVVPDWRDVVLGASTLFNCSEAGLTGILRVWTRDGSAESDCRAFGDSPERWATWDLGVSCATALPTDP